MVFNIPYRGEFLMATRMQQRRGTATQWTDANPVLSAGEIGFETDTGQFKMGDGIANWIDLSYFKNLEDLGGSLDDYILLTEKGVANGVATLNESAQIPIEQLATIIQNAPTTLDTLQEIAAAINDANGIVNSAISAAIAEEVTDRNTAISDAISTEVADRNTAINTSRTEIAGDIQTAITDRLAAATTSDIDEGTNEYFTIERAQDAVASMISGTSGIVATYDDATNSLTISTDSTLATDTDLSTAISDHNSDTLNVHGIANTAELETQTGAQAKADNALTAAAAYSDGLAVNYDAAGDAEAAQTAAEATAAGLYATKIAPTITGTATVENITVTGNLVVQGTTTTVDTANLDVTDSLIYLASEQFDTDVLDIGIFGAYGDVQAGHAHTGLIRDASDSKWKLISAGPEPVANVIDFSSVTYDTLKLGGVEYPDGVQVKQGVPSLTSINQQTAAYTTVLSDRDKLVEINSSTGVTLTIPTEASVAYPVGTSFDILQTGAGQITIAGAAGVTVNATPGLKLRTQWSSATLFKRAADTWVVYGDLSA